MNKIINIAFVGLGQIGNYLLNEINNKKHEIEIKTGKKIKITLRGVIQIYIRKQYQVDI